MFKTMVVPLDGSALAAKALPYAEVLARRHDGRLILVRSLERVTASEHRRVEQELEGDVEVRAELQAVADAATARGVPAGVAIYHGEPSRAIEMAVEQADADAIVMSTHGRGGLARWAYGSVAERVLRSSSVPVLTVPAHSQLDWTEGLPGPVLIALDGSAMAEQTLEPAEALARSLGTGISLLEVIEPPNTALYASVPGAVFPPDTTQEWVEEAKPYLRDVAHRLQARGLTVTAQTMIGYAAASITAVARENKASAIAMASHGRSGFARLALGSVTTGVLQRAEMPVLVVHARVAPAESAPKAPAAAAAG